jgi:hypothetical protein
VPHIAKASMSSLPTSPQEVTVRPSMRRTEPRYGLTPQPKSDWPASGEIRRADTVRHTCSFGDSANQSGYLAGMTCARVPQAAPRSDWLAGRPALHLTSNFIESGATVALLLHPVARHKAPDTSAPARSQRRYGRVGEGRLTSQDAN